MKYLAVHVVAFLFLPLHAYAGTWTTLNAPGANSTYITDIDGTNIVGYYGSLYHEHSFIYDGTTWTTLDMPTATATRIAGISGNKIVGTYSNSTRGIPGPWHGFLYDGTNWITFDNYALTGISGNTIVGSTGRQSYLYDGTEWTKFEFSGAANTNIYGISGDQICGAYDTHGFIYNMVTQTWTTLDAPAAARTRIYDLEGNNIVGQFTADGKATSFLYDGTTWLSLDVLGGPGFDSQLGISGDTVVGSYSAVIHYDNGATGYFTHGFTYTIPEPATLLLFALGTICGRRRI